MRSRATGLVVAVLFIMLLVGVMFQQGAKLQPSASPTPGASAPTGAPSIAASPLGLPSPAVSVSPGASPLADASSMAQSSTLPAAIPGEASTSSPDLTVDANGLSRATVVMVTSSGTVKFKFYPKDAPNTVNRFIELVGKGFYNGLKFHRVVPGFVVQGGDPKGDGTGGSGQRLKAEFNTRRHIEGTVAMARAGSDPDSADSQFYFSLGTFPHLDRNYTVFGQVTEGLDIIRNIKIDDKIVSMTLQ
jgi:cyclophilin family peptidyl-prolyl cis-trans isomerase